jgi:hypothetical protein
MYHSRDGTDVSSSRQESYISSIKSAITHAAVTHAAVDQISSTRSHDHRALKSLQCGTLQVRIISERALICHVTKFVKVR